MDETGDPLKVSPISIEAVVFESSTSPLNMLGYRPRQSRHSCRHRLRRICCLAPMFSSRPAQDGRNPRPALVGKGGRFRSEPLAGFVEMRKWRSVKAYTRISAVTHQLKQVFLYDRE